MTTPQAVDSLERIRKALETQALTHPGVAICDKSDLRSLLAREAALREALEQLLTVQDALDNRELMGPNAEDYSVLMRRRNHARNDARAALASTEPTKEAR